MPGSLRQRGPNTWQVRVSAGRDLATGQDVSRTVEGAKRYASLLRRGPKPLSVRKCHAVLSAALRQAVKWGWIDRNPLDRASPPSTRSADVIPPTVDEVRTLLSLCERHRPLGPLVGGIRVAKRGGCSAIAGFCPPTTWPLRTDGLSIGAASCESSYRRP